MKVFARWIKAPLDNHSEEEYHFRKNTILQFGNSWDIIGAAILINPGSALPTNESIDCETISRLQKISDIYDKKDEWRVFNSDSTMRFLEKIFSGWYLGKSKRLNGVILLYNLFNIKCADLKEALKLRKAAQFEDLKDMTTTPADITSLNVPIYIGWGNTGKCVLSDDANKIFEAIVDRVCYYTGENLCKAACYHPLYVNTSYRKEATKHLLCRFLRVEGDIQPFLAINISVGLKIIENLKKRIDKSSIVESLPSKLSFKLCNGKLVFSIISQKSRQYVCFQHANYNKRRNYRDNLPDYEYASEIRVILESYGYNVASDSSLGEKSLNDFAAMNIEDISNMIWEEIQELTDRINNIYKETES